MIESYDIKILEQCHNNSDRIYYKLDKVDHAKLMYLRCGCEYDVVAANKTTTTTSSSFPIFPQSCGVEGDMQKFQIEIKTHSDVLEVEETLLNDLRDIESETKFEKSLSTNEDIFENKFVDQMNRDIKSIKENHDKLKATIDRLEEEQNSQTSWFPDPFGILKTIAEWIHEVIWIGVLIVVVLCFVLLLLLLCRLYRFIGCICYPRQRTRGGPDNWA